MSSVMVDVNYRGLELGTGLMMSEFGPSTALIETPAPLPVGASLEVTPEGGAPIAVTVIRVYEETSGATELPGMRVRAAELGGDSATWWNGNESVADPIVPEPVGAVPVAPEPVAEASAEAPVVGGVTVPMAAVPDPDAASAAPRGKKKPKKRSSRRRTAEPTPPTESASDETEVSAQTPVEPAEAAPEAPVDPPLKGSSTVRMSVQELKDAGIPIPDEDSAAAPAAQASSPPQPDTVDEPLGKKKKRRRRKKR